METYVKPEIEVIDVCLDDYIIKSSQSEQNGDIGWSLLEPNLINTQYPVDRIFSF